MRPHQLFLFTLIILISFSCCSIEKRIYTPGYAIEVKDSKNFYKERKCANNKDIQAINSIPFFDNSNMQRQLSIDEKSSSDFVKVDIDKSLTASINRPHATINTPFINNNFLEMQDSLKTSKKNSKQQPYYSANINKENLDAMHTKPCVLGRLLLIVLLICLGAILTFRY